MELQRLSHYLFSISFIVIASIASFTIAAIPWQCAPGQFDLNTLYPDLVRNHVDHIINNTAIGEGSDGRVYIKAHGPTLQVVKRFFPETSPLRQALQECSIHAEYWLGHSISHPSLARSYSLGHVNGKWEMAMEFIPFPLLDLLDYDAWAERRWSWEAISCVFLQILDGITHLHLYGFSHRDIKVENIMVDRDGTVKIIDFGSASPLRDFLTGRKLLSWENKVGTPITMPPEAEEEEFYDLEKGDVWALGVVLVRLWLGVYPWEEAMLQDDAFAEYVKEREKIEDCADDVDSLICSLPRVAEYVGGMLETTPAKRITMDNIQSSEWMRNTRADMNRIALR